MTNTPRLLRAIQRGERHGPDQKIWQMVAGKLQHLGVARGHRRLLYVASLGSKNDRGRFPFPDRLGCSRSGWDDHMGRCLSATAWARGRMVRARYDTKLLAQGGEIDPLAKIFEKKRIFLNEFVLPSHPIIEDKTFIDCEIIGPASVILNVGNTIDNHRLPYCDAYVMRNGAKPFNGYLANRCSFRGCCFIRVSLMFSLAEYDNAKGVDWLNWVSIRPDHLDEAILPSPAPADEQKLVEAPEKRHWPWQRR